MSLGDKILLQFLKGTPLTKDEYEIVFPFTAPTPKGHCPKLLKNGTYSKIREQASTNTLSAQILDQHLENLEETIELFQDAILSVLNSSEGSREETNALTQIGRPLGYVLFKFEGEKVTGLNPQIYYAFKGQRKYETLLRASGEKMGATAEKSTPTLKKENPEKTAFLNTIAVQPPIQVEISEDAVARASYIPIQELAAMDPESLAEIIAEERGYALQEHIEQLTPEQRAVYALTNQKTMAIAMVYNPEHHTPETLVECAKKNPDDAIKIINFGFGEPLRAVLKNAPPYSIAKKVTKVVNQKEKKKRRVTQTKAPRHRAPAW